MKQLEYSWNKLLAKRLVTSAECWEFQGCRTKDGYGQVWNESTKKVEYAHRVAFEYAFGSIPQGFDVLHKCDNPPCWNPDHLFTGTATDNLVDAANKKRHWKSKVTHCPRGHEYTLANTLPSYVVLANGQHRQRRRCRKCHGIVSELCRQRRRRRNKEALLACH